MPELRDPPEPTERDEELALAFIELRDAAELQGRPNGDRRCAACRYYLDPGHSVSYCWNPHLQIGVGHDHWCRWWAPSPDRPPG